MKTSKIVALLLISALAITLVACGSSENPAPEQASATESAAPSEAVTAEEPQTAPSGPVDEEGAINLALDHSGVSVVDTTDIKVKSDVVDGFDVWDVEFVNGGFEFWYEVVKDTGEIIDFGKE